jgi:hypothetical protein
MWLRSVLAHGGREAQFLLVLKKHEVKSWTCWKVRRNWDYGSANHDYISLVNLWPLRVSSFLAVGGARHIRNMAWHRNPSNGCSRCNIWSRIVPGNAEMHQLLHVDIIGFSVPSTVVLPLCCSSSCMYHHVHHHVHLAILPSFMHGKVDISEQFRTRPSNVECFGSA